MSRRTRNEHAWRTRTEDGRRREVRARLFGSTWTLSSRAEDEDDWTVHEPPLVDDLLELENVLFRKYQRKRLGWEHLRSVRELLGMADEEAPGGPRLR